MRALILGSLVPQTARTVWRWLAAGHEIEEIWIGENSAGVWQRRDRRLRWFAPTWSIGAAARRFGIRVRRVGPLKDNPALIAEGRRSRVDVLLASCFPYLVPEPLLSYYHGRACNFHPALLPRYRGPAPMFAMVFDEALDASGITLHLMSSRFDAGDMIAQEPVAWPADGYYRTWEADLADAAARLAVDALPQFLAERRSASPQQGAGNYARGVPPGGLELSDRIDQRRTRWLCDSLGRVMPLSIAAPGGAVAVGPLLAECGAPTGQSARIGWGRVEFDVADARLSVRRWDVLRRRSERLRELAGLARRPLAA